MHAQMSLATVARLGDLSADMAGQRERQVGRLDVFLEICALGRQLAALQTLVLVLAGFLRQLCHPVVNV